MGKANPELPVIKMSPKQAAAALDLAGWPRDQWATGVAVGMGESGLDVTVANEGGAAGWLQILRSAHKDMFSALPNKYAWTDPVTNAKMAKKIYDGAGHSWRPWQAYTGPDGSGSNGPYRKSLGTAQSAVDSYEKDIKGLSAKEKKAYQLKLFGPLSNKIAAVQLLKGSGLIDSIASAGEKTGQATVDSGAAVVDAVGKIGKEMAAFSDFFQALLLPGTWLRIGAGLVGVMLVIAGLVALGKEASATS